MITRVRMVIEVDCAKASAILSECLAVIVKTGVPYSKFAILCTLLDERCNPSLAWPDHSTQD